MYSTSGKKTLLCIDTLIKMTNMKRLSTGDCRAGIDQHNHLGQF